MGATRSRLRRWHVWLGWIIALPILFWTVSGLVMVWKPIEEVRGTDLLKEEAPIQLADQPILPGVAGLPIQSMALKRRSDGPRWIITLKDGTTRLADPATGRYLPPLSAADAAREVSSRYSGSASIESVTRTDANRPPIDLRRPIATWRVAMADGTRFYVDSGSGEIIARRTRWWRFYDWMWGLHIMDMNERENTHNPLVVTFGLLALLMSLLAIILLPLTINRRRSRRLSSKQPVAKGGQEA